MALVRARQRVVTGLFPHQANRQYIKARGKLASAGPHLPPVGDPPAPDLDADGLPDTVIALPGQFGVGTPGISIDADSINIDTDGDGDADIVVPR